MKRLPFLSLLTAAFALNPIAVGTIADAAQSPLGDAAGLWNFRSTADSSRNSNDLTGNATASFGIPLAGNERKGSALRGGDGYIARTDGTPLIAVKHSDALVDSSNEITLLVRAKDPTGAWGGELIKRREPTLSYNLYTYDFGKGPKNMMIGFEIGTAGHPFNTCLFPMDRLPDRKSWLDIIARYNGKSMELIVNGVLMATAPAVGNLIDAPDDIFTIGNKFSGELDTAAVWKRALSDTEIDTVSDTNKVAISPYLDTSTNRGPYYVSYQEKIDSYNASGKGYTEQFRPQFHWTPISGWMNDPNGLVYFNHLWRQFAQHNLDNETGKRWAYATSPNLVNWAQHPEAIMPDSLGEIWSGSAVVDQHDTSGFFHGKSGIVCIYTYFNGNEDGRQCQAIAYSADGITFKKYSGNPVIPELRYVTGQEDDKDFRDPKVFWYKPTARWIMVTGGGFLRIWSSTDLKHWRNERVEKDIQTECPDLFPLYLDGNKSSDPVWVLSRAGASYMLGHFDGHEFTPTTSTMRFNFGPDFYAAQTYSNVPGGRRIMSAWMWGWGDDDPSGISTTGGMMTLPAELSLVTTPDGPRVKSYPVSELNVLRGTPFTGKNIALSADTEIQNTSSGNQCDIEADIDMGSAQNAGICVLKDSFGASTIVGYDAKKSAVYVDRGNSGLKNVNNAGSYYSAPLSLNNNRLHLSIYVDHATVEVFANNGIVPITVRCFPPADATNITAFANGGNASLPQIKVYPMSSIWKR